MTTSIAGSWAARLAGSAALPVSSVWLAPLDCATLQQLINVYPNWVRPAEVRVENTPKYSSCYRLRKLFLLGIVKRRPYAFSGGMRRQHWEYRFVPGMLKLVDARSLAC